MNDEELAKRLENGVGSPHLWRLRRITATAVGRGFCGVGLLLALTNDTKKPDCPQTAALSMILLMAGELTRASAKLLASGQHYAGAALLRQIVEIEYLTWTFKEGYRDPEKWLSSSHRERMQDFTPAQLRQTSHGRFLSKDYQNHCEQGGHPAPPGAHLLGGKNKGVAQLLLADLITHSWRTWDYVQKWASSIRSAQPVIKAGNSKIYPALSKWGDLDPLYKAMVERYPDVDVKP